MDAAHHRALTGDSCYIMLFCVLFNFLFGYIAVTLHYGMDVVGFYKAS